MRFSTRQMSRVFLFYTLALSVWLVGCDSDDAEELIDFVTVASSDITSIEIAGGIEVISVGFPVALTLNANTDEGVSSTDLTSAAD